MHTYNSGECSATLEINRGHWKLKSHQEACVKRRAALSLSQNPACNGKVSDFINAAWPLCSRDTEPFDANP
jgi:mitochondrial inner membrane protease ATP23